jgi:phosphoribosylglycinamide formyltransferase 1
MPTLSGVVLLSGHGSNLQAIINACQHGLAFNILAVISDCPKAYGLERAKEAQLPAHVIAPAAYTDRKHWNQALLTCLQSYQPDLVVCAGFMRIISAEVVSAYRYRILNVHPSLLPKYPGLHTHQRVLDHGDQKHGSTVHLVTEVLDQGPILTQDSIDVEPGDTKDTLDSKIKSIEHKRLPMVIGWYASGKLIAGQKPSHMPS